MNLSIFKSICFLLLLTPFVIMAGCKNDVLVYQVNDVVSDPGAYSGVLIVEGVVAAFAQDDPSVVGVMDKKELQCTTPNCNKVLLPIKISDSKLAIGDEVKVTGSMVNDKRWRYILKADKVQVVNKHKLGGV